MILKFTCHGCGLKDAEVRVRDREPEETIESWMITVRRTVGFTHSAHSPQCRERKCDLKIPAPEEGRRVGEAAKPPE